MALPLILARTFKEAHAYAKDKLDLRIGHYRVVNSPGTIKAVRNTDLHLVPGWDKRPDRFTMQSAIRYCHLTIVDPTKEPVAPAAPAPTPPNDGVEADDSVGDFFDLGTSDGIVAAAIVPEPSALVQGFRRQHEKIVPSEPAFPVDPEVATELDAIVEPTPENIPTVVSDEAQELDEAASKKRRRRTRCKECGNLHFKEESCPEGDS